MSLMTFGFKAINIKVLTVSKGEKVAL